MSYEFITQYDSPNYTPGRPSAPQFIVIHYWGVMGQKFENVVRYLCRPNGNTSAHYVVEDGRVACIVDPKDTAWHAGNWAANQKGIGIECRPEATDGDYQTVGELVKRLRDIYGDLPLYPHNKFKSTDCPGSWDLERIDCIARGLESATPKNTYVDGVFMGDDGTPANWWYDDGEAWYFFKDGKKFSGLASDSDGEHMFKDGKYLTGYHDALFYEKGLPCNWWCDDGSAWYFFQNGRKFTGKAQDNSGEKYFVCGKYANGYIDNRFVIQGNPANWWYSDGSDWYFFKDGIKFTGTEKDNSGEHVFKDGKYA